MDNSNNLFTNDYVSSSRIIYTPSSFARSSLFYLQETGTLQAIRPHVSSRANLQSYLFFIVLSGEGWVEYNGINYKLDKGCAVFIDCRKGYRQSSGDELWQLKWCHFNSANMGAVYNKWMERGGKNVFRPNDPEQFISLLSNLHLVAEGEDFVRDIHINEQLTKLVSLLMEQTVYDEHRVNRDDTSPVDRIIAARDRVDVGEVKSYIDTHYNESLSLEGLAERFFINKSYLARLFKEAYGMTVGSYIQLARIGKAKEMLRFSDRTIEQLSCECGYGGDSNYFSRVFKKVEGCSPREYRRNWRNGGGS